MWCEMAKANMWYAASLLVYTIVLSSQTTAEPEDDDSFPVIHTSNGPVQGFKFISTWTKKTIYAFRGIPYAAPPLGNLRFKDPVPPENWTSVRNCTEDQPSCMQNSDTIIGYRNITFEMSEDCLYLNIYTPQVPKEGDLLPVMVWIHGGAFIEGSGSYFRYGPDFLVGEGVVVVTLNYRLGALGFLTLGTSELPGNAGVKDQNFALKWVQKNIPQFGGDPGKVTLFGESAGSASVHLQYLSPLSKGLFQRAIGESGTALTEWAVNNNAHIYGKKLAEKVNCSSDDLAFIGKCLKEAKAEDITAAQLMVHADPEDGRSSQLVFVPSIDKNTSSQPFLPDTPTKLIEEKQESFVPFIMGINSDEGMMLLSSDKKIMNITNNLEPLIPIEIRKKCTESRLKLLTERLKQFYFKEPPSPTNLRGYIDLFTDQMFGYSTAVSARVFRERATVYLYYFAFNGKFKEFIVSMLENKYNFSGVSHAEELNYIFERKKVNQEASEDSIEMKTWRRMVRLWTNFAKYGKPTVGKDTELQDVDWKPVRNMTTNYLLIDSSLMMVESDFLASRVALWDSITPSKSSYLNATGLLVGLAVTLYMWLNTRTSG